MPHVWQRCDDCSCTLPYHVTPRPLKSFFLGYICKHMRRQFSHRLSYNRFVERQAKVELHLLLFLQTCALGKCTGISIIDSTPLVSSHIQRADRHRMMKRMGTQGQMHDGMVLRLQAAHRNQRLWRDNTMGPYAGQCQRPWIVEKQWLHLKAVWKDIRWQGCISQELLRKPLTTNSRMYVTLSIQGAVRLTTSRQIWLPDLLHIIWCPRNHQWISTLLIKAGLSHRLLIPNSDSLV